jgi:hypothetical protein
MLLGMRSTLLSFSPSALFAAGEQGAWYDPSDMTTLFQDSSGTTPVTAVEQTVGRMLDKSGRGNHATQATPSARPVLSARFNLLTKTESFNDAVWVSGSFTGTITNNTSDTLDPLGGTTASKLNATATNSFIYQSIAVIAQSYTYSFYAKAGTATSIRINVFDTSDHRVVFNLTDGTSSGSSGLTSSSATNVGNGWWRLSITYTGGAATNQTRVLCPEIGVVYVWGADLRLTNDTAFPAYQRVDTSTSYDTTGFPMYLLFDGSDDALSTSSVDFSGTGALSVFAGVRKIGSPAVGTVWSLGSSNSSSGYAQFFAPRNSNDYGWRGFTAANGALDVQTSAYSSPITNVATGLFDAAAASPIIGRINGVQAASGGSGLATAFANQPMYIGIRGIDLPFNGRLYSIIVRGTTTSASDIAKTEKWISDEMGGGFVP